LVAIFGKRPFETKETPQKETPQKESVSEENNEL
jgi:hypothetical protein